MAAEDNTSTHPDNIQPVHIGGESFADRVAPHLKKILIGIGVLMVVLIAVFTVRWIGERGRAEESAKLAEAVAAGNQPVRAAGEEAKPGEKSFASSKERAAAILDALAKKPSELATATFRGSLAFQAEQYDTAITEFRKDVGAAGIEGVLAREGLTLALEAKATAEKDAAAKQKGLEEALTAARAIQPDANGTRRAYGLYHEARLLMLLGKGVEAKAAFEKVKTMAEGTELDGLAEARLAQLEAAS